MTQWLLLYAICSSAAWTYVFLHDSCTREQVSMQLILCFKGTVLDSWAKIRINHLTIKTSKAMKENTSVLMQDIQFDLGKGLLEGIEISSNPLRMEDDVLDGYNEETGEWEIPQESMSKEVYVVIRNKKDLNDYQSFFGVNDVVAVFEQIGDAYDCIFSMVDSILETHDHVVHLDDSYVEYEDEDLWTTIGVTYRVETYTLQ